MDDIQLNIVTPEASFFSGKVSNIIVRTTEGDIGFMKNHLPFVAGLNTGFLRIKVAGQEKKAITTNGFVKFIDNEVNILTDFCQWAEDVDKNEITKKLDTLKKIESKNPTGVDKDINNKNIVMYEKLLKLLSV